MKKETKVYDTISFEGEDAFAASKLWHFIRNSQNYKGFHSFETYTNALDSEFTLTALREETDKEVKRRLTLELNRKKKLLEQTKKEISALEKELK